MCAVAVARDNIQRGARRNGVNVLGGRQNKMGMDRFVNLKCMFLAARNLRTFDGTTSVCSMIFCTIGIRKSLVPVVRSTESIHATCMSYSYSNVLHIHLPLSSPGSATKIPPRIEWLALINRFITVSSEICAHACASHAHLTARACVASNHHGADLWRAHIAICY